MKQIILVYPDGISGMGFGDYLSGCLGITEWSLQHAIDVDYYFENHPISLYYEYAQPDAPDTVQNIYCSQDAEDFLTTFLKSSQERLHLISNWNPYKEYSPQTLKKVQKILTPSSELVEAVDSFLETVRSYRIVHIRLDDAQFNEPSKHANTIEKLCEKYVFDGSTIVISNNVNIKKELVTRENWSCYDSRPVHLGSPQYKTGDVFDTCVELELLKRASSILQFSVYNWPSNFSKRISELYSIPLDYVPIRNEMIEYYKSMGAEFEYHNK